MGTTISRSARRGAPARPSVGRAAGGHDAHIVSTRTKYEKPTYRDRRTRNQELEGVVSPCQEACRIGQGRRRRLIITPCHKSTRCQKRRRRIGRATEYRPKPLRAPRVLQTPPIRELCRRGSFVTERLLRTCKYAGKPRSGRPHGPEHPSAYCHSGGVECVRKSVEYEKSHDDCRPIESDTLRPVTASAKRRDCTAAD